jgi:hypothetical protein
MLTVKTQKTSQVLDKGYRKQKVARKDIDRLKTELPRLLNLTGEQVESEATLRDHLQSFLRNLAYPASDFLVQSEVRRMDTVIHDGPKKKDPIGVIIEAKIARNRAEMFHPEKPDCKALYELVLYFVRERELGNVAIKNLMITDGNHFYLFADSDFERLFWNKKKFRKQLLTTDADQAKNNPIAYEVIARHIAELSGESLPCTAVKLDKYRPYCEDGDPATDAKLIDLYKILSPEHLLRRPFANDSNKLDKRFYRELLHIMGLEERFEDPKKKSGKKVIDRLPEGQRQAASLLENVLDMAETDGRFANVQNFNSYGSDRTEREFAVALELCLTWVNRVLFLKLLESQLLSYHSGDQRMRFLTTELVPDYDALHSLFFKVLAKPSAERKPIVAVFAHVPYLNSSLFEPTELENQVLYVHALKDQHELPLALQSVLGTRDRAQSLSPSPSPGERGAMPPLRYLFDFLDAYDFSSEGKAAIQEENKRLINASVLGLIFEKINGYRDGSFYTPGFITEYMCRETIRRAVVQKFRDDQGLFADFDSADFGDLANFLGRHYTAADRLAANALVNSLTVCDPAVGSGHFLVSALNELIATKSELGILGADAGAKEVRISAEVANDELLITDLMTGEPYTYLVGQAKQQPTAYDDRIQLIQETIFHEKRTLIENCLFGVDLNPNSVKICRLRLWIELLKSAYYRTGREAGGLETLPNIDINIKQGNSLISRFALDDDLSKALSAADDLTLADYRKAVADYHRATGPDEKYRLLELIDKVKHNFQSHIARGDQRVKDLAKFRGKLLQLEGLLEVGDLFGSVDAKKVTAEIKPLRAKVDSLEAELAGIRNNAIYQNAFEWRFEFPAVLGAEGEFLGFDVVVGNPPYIRQEELGEAKSYLKDHYEVYAGTADLLVYFMELAMKNLRPQGQFSFIISNKFMRAGFGKALRRYLQQFRVIELIDFGDLQVFDGATTYPLVISLEKAPPTGEFFAMNVPDLVTTAFREQVSAERFVSLQSELTEDGWNLADVQTQRLLEKLRNTGVPLGEYVNGEIYYGIKTGYNEAFVIDAATKDRLIAEDSKSAEVIKPFLAGRDVKRYVPPVAEKYLILLPKGWTKGHLGDVDESTAYEFLFEMYPAIAAHLKQHAKAARKRYDKGDFYWELRACDYYDKFEEPKILYQEIMTYQSFTYDYNSIYTNNKLFVIPGATNFLLGVLNTQLIWFILKNTATSYNGGAIAMQSPFVLPLPIVDESEVNKTISSLATQILTQKQSNPTADTTSLEAEIDVLVYRLYGLTYAEVLVVDGAFGMGEETYNALKHE